MPSLSDTVAANLKRLIDALGWTYADVEQHSGIHKVSVGLYLNGKKKPTIETIEKFARAFGVHPWQILKADEDLAPARSEPTPQEALAIIARALGEPRATGATAEIAGLLATVDQSKHAGIVDMIRLTVDAHLEEDASSVPQHRKKN